MHDPQLASFYYQALKRVATTVQSPAKQVIGYRQVLKDLFVRQTEDDNQHFTDLFTRMLYVFQKQPVDGQTRRTVS